MLEIKNLSKNYGTTSILDNVSLTVHPGEIAIFLGHSGVGKSTLLRMLNTLEPTEHGKIDLNGQSLSKTSIGMVFQHFNLFSHLTAIQNLLLPLTTVLKKTKQEAIHTAQSLLKDYSLSSKADLLPKNLSGGQKQRLAIVRSVAMTPLVLCMDEPTSALDPKHTNQIIAHIKNLASQKYIILIATHDIAILEKIDCTIHLMEHGQIVESAPSSSLLHTKKKYTKI